MSVNVSPIQFLGNDMVATVSRALAGAGCPPAGLMIELTESVAIAAPETMALCLAQLRALGVRVAIDDFGTGYSCLHHLKRYPVDTVKIDRRFVRGLAACGADAASADAVIVQTVIALAASMRDQAGALAALVRRFRLERDAAPPAFSLARAALPGAAPVRRSVAP
jgi:EAL domain-containing protein (putative c-di-GMP-specific phosphodiesterase class I)